MTESIVFVSFVVWERILTYVTRHISLDEKNQYIDFEKSVKSLLLVSLRRRRRRVRRHRRVEYRESYFRQRTLAVAVTSRIEAKDAISWVNTTYKRNYDRRHQSLFLKEGDWALLKLHHGYSIPSARSKKLSQQYLGPFKVVQKVGVSTRGCSLDTSLEQPWYLPVGVLW